MYSRVHAVGGEDIRTLSAKWQNVGWVGRILYNFNDTHLNNDECESSLIKRNMQKSRVYVNYIIMPITIDSMTTQHFKRGNIFFSTLFFYDDFLF